jgi:hypothetical protein
MNGSASKLPDFKIISGSWIWQLTLENRSQYRKDTLPLGIREGEPIPNYSRTSKTTTYFLLHHVPNRLQYPSWATGLPMLAGYYWRNAPTNSCPWFSWRRSSGLKSCKVSLYHEWEHCEVTTHHNQVSVTNINIISLLEMHLSSNNKQELSTLFTDL